MLIFREQHLHEVGLKTFRFYQFLRLQEKNSQIATHSYKIARKRQGCSVLNNINLGTEKYAILKLSTNSNKFYEIVKIPTLR